MNRLNRVSLAAAASIALSAAAFAQEIRVDAFHRMKDERSGFLYMVVAERDILSGRSDPCTYSSPMIGLPVDYRLVVGIPRELRDRLLDHNYASEIIAGAARAFDRMCPNARLYSSNFAPSEMNTNSLEVYVLLMDGDRLVRYENDGEGSVGSQYVLRAKLRPRGDASAGRGRWHLADLHNDFDNRVVRDEPQRQAAVEERQRQVLFEQQERARARERRITRRLPSGDVLIDLGAESARGAHVWLKPMNNDVDQPCGVTEYVFLRAVSIIDQGKVASLSDQDVRRLLTDASSRVRKLCPQTQICETIQSFTLTNPLAPPQPPKQETRCTTYPQPPVRVFVAPPDFRMVEGGIYGPEPEPVLVSATIAGNGDLTNYEDYTLRQIRQKVALQRRKDAARVRFDEFANRHRIASWPSAGSLDANPFVLEGKIIGLHAELGTMISADRGLFVTINSTHVLVSGVPGSEFTSRHEVVLAARVLGKERVTMPLVGEILVPHVRYVASHHCQQNGCAEILGWR